MARVARCPCVPGGQARLTGGRHLMIRRAGVAALTLHDDWQILVTSCRSEAVSGSWLRFGRLPPSWGSRCCRLSMSTWLDRRAARIRLSTGIRSTMPAPAQPEHPSHPTAIIIGRCSSVRLTTAFPALYLTPQRSWTPRLLSCRHSVRWNPFGRTMRAPRMVLPDQPITAAPRP